MAKTTPRCVAVIQCDVAHERCTGTQCAVAFASRQDYFAAYGPDIPYYVPFGCGGCPGRRVGRLAVNIRNVMKKNGVEPADIVVHLASCVVSDNGHYPPCPHIADIKTMLARKGLRVVEGSYISKGAARKREAGLYAPMPPLDNVTDPDEGS